MPPARASTEPWVPVPLNRWEPPHPVTAALLAGQLTTPKPETEKALPRSPELASALAQLNRRWGNPVDEELKSWLSGASVVVAGQQPGLWGGPLLSLVKACAVAAEVARLREAGQPAVGFFWLETRDDDLPEMGWGRVVVGGQLLEARESWTRGEACGFAAVLSPLSSERLQEIPQDALPPGGLEAFTVARECFAPGRRLGEACGLFFARLLRGLGLVLVDASLPELAHASAWAAQKILEKLEEAWGCLEHRARELAGQGLPLPLRLRRDLLPFFRLEQGRRRRLAAKSAFRLLSELAHHPERLAPNVWLRPLLQDAALGTTTAILGSSELAYHWQAQDLWELAGVSQPRWQLRPHITVVGPAERRWAEKLGVAPEELLSPRLPRRLLRTSGLVRDWERLTQKWLADLQRFAENARAEQPSLTGDLEATLKKLMGSFSWLAHRLETRAEERLQLERQRFFRLRQSLRPLGQPQERALSVLSPLLSLGISFPLRLSKALSQLPWDGMQLLYWEDSGLW